MAASCVERVSPSRERALLFRLILLLHLLEFLRAVLRGQNMATPNANDSRIKPVSSHATRRDGLSGPFTCSSRGAVISRRTGTGSSRPAPGTGNLSKFCGGGGEAAVHSSDGEPHGSRSACGPP